MFRCGMDVQERIGWFEVRLHVEDARFGEPGSRVDVHVQIDGFRFANTYEKVREHS